MQLNTTPADYLDCGLINPRDYQWGMFNAITQAVRQYVGPAFINASVGAGKTIGIGMLAKRCQDTGMVLWVLARQGELVDQNSQEMWRMGVKNSVYSASLGKKSTLYPILCGTEGTVCRSLNTELKGAAPDMLAIDETHMVDWQDVISEEPKSQYAIIINELLRRNPKLKIIGLTGSPYRGSESIIGPFWTGGMICDISTDYLVGRGYLVPTVFGFGHDDLQYDLSQFTPPGGDGAKDFASKEMQAMQREILKDATRTQEIMLEVMHLAKDRGGVLITCAGKRHCEEAAKFLPEGSFGIITDDTGAKKRKKVLDAARAGEIKYVLQVGCLTTGVNVPIWDVCVILRRIGSLTLLIQLIGRVMRTYFTDEALGDAYHGTAPEMNAERQQMIDSSTKPNCLVLDYSDTMATLGELYSNPILEEAQLQKAKQDNEYITCPDCGQENSKFARRCVSRDANGNRCEYFFKSRECDGYGGCGTLNDIVARECRSCGKQLIDPNANLSGKHYSDADLIPVTGMVIKPTKGNDGIIVEYHTLDPRDPVATVFYHPFNKQHQWMRGAWLKFIKEHIGCPIWQKRAFGFKSVDAILKNKSVFNCPTHITHRRNEKNKSLVNRKVFASGRETQQQD